MRYIDILIIHLGQFLPNKNYDSSKIHRLNLFIPLILPNIKYI